MEITKRTDADIIAEVESLQGIQKRNRPDSAPSLEASAELAPLFAEMARRQKERGVSSI